MTLKDVFTVAKFHYKLPTTLVANPLAPWVAQQIEKTNTVCCHTTQGAKASKATLASNKALKISKFHYEAPRTVVVDVSVIGKNKYCLLL